MTADGSGSLSERLAKASDEVCSKSGIPPVEQRRLDDALINAITPRKLVNNLAEAWRVSDGEARAMLEKHGFGGLLARAPLDLLETGKDDARADPLCGSEIFGLADGEIRVRAFNPSFDAPVAAPPGVLDAVSTGIRAFLSSAADDVLGVLYRRDVAAYAAQFLGTDAPLIDAYIKRHFGEAGPRYIVNTGIGANEQFNHFVAALANARPEKRATWLLANSPKEIADLPDDATVQNTLFMEFSRSGTAEETVKQHELTPRDARRIVFGNSGPLRELAERDGNLVMDLPGEVSGRYGRNKTPILMAPMHVAGLDVRAYWSTIESACGEMDISDRSALPVVLAQYIRIQQCRRGVNHIYLGTNDRLLRFSADELCQFWNEGVNRDGNDITMSRYLGLPRDSHMNLEAILGTSERKMAVFLLRTGDIRSHPALTAEARPLRPEHSGLTPGDVDLVLALANVKRCSEKMPTVLISVGCADLTASAWLGQLWADTTLVYARLIGVDPGSNPEVKTVRSRAAEWLADKAAAFAMISGDAPAPR